MQRFYNLNQLLCKTCTFFHKLKLKILIIVCKGRPISLTHNSLEPYNQSDTSRNFSVGQNNNFRYFYIRKIYKIFIKYIISLHTKKSTQSYNYKKLNFHKLQLFSVHFHILKIFYDFFIINIKKISLFIIIIKQSFNYYK